MHMSQVAYQFDLLSQTCTNYQRSAEGTVHLLSAMAPWLVMWLALFPHVESTGGKRQDF
jgi:hypothetical protein